MPATLATKPVKTGTCLPSYGIDYTGDLAVTLGGHTCLQWSAAEAQALSKNKEFISEVTLQGNKCRNPDNDPEGPWCYVRVSGNVTVDYCDLELCGKYYKYPLRVPVLLQNITQVISELSPYLLPVCLPEDPLVGDVSTTETQGMERSVLAPARKTFFNLRSFGQGENGESPRQPITTG